MSKGSPMRRIRRAAMKANHATYAQRLQEAIRNGQAVRAIRWQDPPVKKETI